MAFDEGFNLPRVGELFGEDVEVEVDVDEVEEVENGDADRDRTFRSVLFKGEDLMAAAVALPSRGVGLGVGFNECPNRIGPKSAIDSSSPPGPNVSPKGTTSPRSSAGLIFLRPCC
jgi:hypothetical protein